MRLVNYDPESSDGGEVLLVHEASSVRPIVEVRVDNYGDAAAAQLLVNIFAPAGLENFRWCSPTGGPAANWPVPYPVGRSAIVCKATEEESQVLPDHPSRLPRRGTDLSFFCFTLPLSETDEVTVPFLATAAADEIPEEVEDYRATLVVRGRRSPVQRF